MLYAPCSMEMMEEEEEEGDTDGVNRYFRLENGVFGQREEEKRLRVRKDLCRPSCAPPLLAPKNLQCMPDG